MYRRIILLLCLTLAPLAVQAQRNSELSLISVTGQAEVQVAPDEVLFTLEVKKMDKDLLAAKQQNDESVRRILALARRFNVQAQDVKTDYISVVMKYTAADTDDDAPPERRVPQFIGYEVSKTVVIRLADMTRFEEFFSEVLKAGISKVEGVEFRTSQIRKHKDAARSMAIRAAREKATALTREIGQTIGRAHSIVEEEFERPRASSNNFSINSSTTSGGGFSTDENSTIAPGLIKISARVSVSFILN